MPVLGLMALRDDAGFWSLSGLGSEGAPGHAPPSAGGAWDVFARPPSSGLAFSP